MNTYSIRRRALFLLMIACQLFLFVGCSEPARQPDDERLHVVATTGFLADAVRQIGGNRIDVVSLIPTGADPHLFKPTHSDVRKILAADMLVYHGLNLEGKMTNIFEKLSSTSQSPAIIEATASISTQSLISETGAPYPDPHIWFDASLWSQVVGEISLQLAAYDENNSEWYLDRATSYRESLDRLHDATVARMNEIPESKRVLITAHDAFSYFGRAYGLEVVGLQGISTNSEFGLGDVQNLIGLIAERNVPAIFTETSVSDRSLRAVQEGSAQAGQPVRIGESLFSDSMGPEGSVTGTFVGAFQHNVEAISNGLGERGSGK